MGSFGERMQREREMRGITLEEIAESTKIGTRSLRALEEEDFEKLPGGIFNKGFVRAYAKYLGIDEEQAVTDFMSALTEYQKTLPVPAEAERAAAAEEPEPASLNWLWVGVAVLLIAVLVGLWTFSAPLSGAARSVVQKLKGTRRPQPHAVAESQAPPAPAPAPQVVNAAPPESTAAAADLTASSPTPGTGAKPLVPAAKKAEIPGVAGEFVLKIHARQDAWVSITADDQVVMEGVLKGDKTVRAHTRVVFRTGNAGAVDVSLNGQAQPPLGADNQVKTVVFTADGIQP